MVALLGLSALVGVTVVLGAVSAAAPWLPARGVAPATAGLCLLAVILAMAASVTGGQAQLLGGRLAIDPLSAFFIVLIGFAGLVCACVQVGRSMAGTMPGFVAAAILAVLAADAPTAILGVALFTLAGSGWRLRSPALTGLFVFGAALAVLWAGAGPSFAAIRSAPPEGWRAGTVLALTVVGLAPLFGWAPWPLPAGGTEPSPVPVATVAPAIGLYLAIRVLADLCGPATPAWWGLPVLVAGGASAVLGVLGALRAPAFGGVLAGLAVQHGGWMLVGLGVASAARSADLLPVATLGLGGALLHALNYTLFGSLAALATDAAGRGAGSRTLDRLGGLAGRMPTVAAGVLVAGFSLAWLPPGAGFASGWMLLQALFAVPRIGGLPLQLVVAAAVAVLGLSAGLGMLATVRMGGVAMLGRPRTPRAAAAEDAGLAERATILGVALLSVLLGLFPGLALRLTGLAQRVVTAAGLDGQGDWAGVRTQVESPGYVPLALVLAIAAGLAVIVLLVRSGRLAAAHAVPAWEDGFAAPPPWMPFGDPATQVTASGLIEGLPTRLPALPGRPRLRLAIDFRWPSLGARPAALGVLMLAVLLLLAVAVFGPA